MERLTGLVKRALHKEIGCGMLAEVVLIKEDQRNRGKWKMGIVHEFITGRDGVVRVAKLRVGKSHLERAIQHLYPLELTSERQTKRPGNELNPDAAQQETRRAARDDRDRLAVNNADDS